MSPYIHPKSEIIVPLWLLAVGAVFWLVFGVERACVDPHRESNRAGSSGVQENPDYPLQSKANQPQ